MLRKGIIILAMILFIAGPAAKVYDLPYSEYYLILSAMGLITITFFFFKKEK